MNVIFFLKEQEVLNYFMLEMARGAEAAGVSCFFVDPEKPETYRNEGFLRMLKEKECILFLMNQFTPMPAWERLGIPVFNFSQDHPRNLRTILAQPSPNLHIITLDRKHADFIRAFFPSVRHIHFMPNGGTREEPVLPYEERDIDVLYCGSCQFMPDTLEEYPFLKDSTAYYEASCVYLLSHPDATTEDAIRHYFESGAEPFPEQENYRFLLMNSARHIEDIVRRHFKLTCMKALDDAGLTVDIYGDGWVTEDVPFSERIRIHSRVDSAASNRMNGRAKISLNFLPWFKDGASERVFNCMLNGAVCVTDKNPYLTERFTDGKELVFFDLDNEKALADSVCDLLEHPEKASEIAARGTAAVACDTWGDRLKEVVRFARE